MTTQRESQVQAHRLVAKVAKEIAGELYDELAKVNAFYAKYPDVNSWIKEGWVYYIKSARKILGTMLTTNISYEQKDIISEALIDDQWLQPTRQHIVQINTGD